MGWLTRPSWHACVRFEPLLPPLHCRPIEDRANALVNRVLIRRGWRESILRYIGYCTSEQLRVLARVILQPPQDEAIVQAASALLYRRGWRNFINAPLVGAPLDVVIGDTRIPVVADRGGFVDVRVRNPGLDPGWHELQLEGHGGARLRHGCRSSPTTSPSNT